MKMTFPENLTFGRVLEIMRANTYVVFHRSVGGVIAVNCGLLKIKHVQQSYQALKPTALSPYISYYPCSFQEYISLKTPFITTKRKRI